MSTKKTDSAKWKKGRAAGLAAALTAVLAVHADNPPSCIVSGDLLANAVEGTSVAFSDGEAFVTGSLSAWGEPTGLDARYRTWDMSEGAALNSMPFLGFTIRLR